LGFAVLEKLKALARMRLDVLHKFCLGSYCMQLHLRDAQRLSNSLYRFFLANASDS